MLQVSAERMTYEEFLHAYDGQRAEWVRGEVVLMSPVSWAHQEILMFLAKILDAFLERKPLGKITLAPYQMRLKASNAAREPDLMFISNERLGLIQEAYLDGPADIAVEIISPDSRARDRGEKYREYEREGVREYWLIDPVRGVAEIYSLGATGEYEPLAIGGDGLFRSGALPGFTLNPEWLWQRPFPSISAIIGVWDLA